MSFTHSDVINRFREGKGTHAKGSRMFFEDNVLYSFGHHFPLAIRRDWGRDVKFLINGDKYSSTTSKHQNDVIRSLKPNVQVPFSALASSGLLNGSRRSSLPLDTLQIKDFRDDRSGYICKRCRQDVEDYWEIGSREKHAACIEVLGEDSWTAYWHRLGAVLLTNNGTDYLSSWDEQEARLYFLVQLPAPVATVDAALESLKPPTVVSALAEGVEVKRQGDIFFIKTGWATRQLPGPSLKMQKLEFNGDTGRHFVSELRKRFDTQYVRGIVRHSNRDHKALKLGYENWWLPVKNMAVASWSARGNVD